MKIAACAIVLAAASACALAQDVPNPVVTSAKEVFQRQSGFMIAAAEQMPADKYGYHPTPDQWSYGKIVSHVILANFGVCGMLSGDRPGSGPAVTDTTPKDQLVTVLKQSFDTCQKALGRPRRGLLSLRRNPSPISRRSQEVARRPFPIELTDDFEDHYSQMVVATWRTNGMLPPSAKKVALVPLGVLSNIRNVRCPILRLAGAPADRSSSVGWSGEGWARSSSTPHVQKRVPSG